MTDVADLTRATVVEELERLELDWGDQEDAVALVDLLLQAFTPAGAYIWLAFYWEPLDGTPVAMLEQGRAREVFREARRIVEERS